MTGFTNSKPNNTTNIVIYIFVNMFTGYLFLGCCFLRKYLHTYVMPIIQNKLFLIGHEHVYLLT